MNLHTVVAELKAKAGQEGALREELLRMVKNTRKEEGCVQYDLHEATEAAGSFVFYENWTSPEALAKHLAAEHMRAFGAKAGDLLDGDPVIRTYSRIA